MIDAPLNLHIPDAAPPPKGRFQIDGARSSVLALAYGRIVMISAIFVLAYIIVVIRAFDLMILQGSFVNFRETHDTGARLVSTVSSPRADIVDRNGVLLATSIKMASLYADPHLILEPVAAARGLSAIFPDQNYGELLNKLQSEKRFVWIKRNLTPDQQAAVLELGQPGLVFQEEYKRLYPQGSLTSHFVGYGGVDGQGLSGVEGGFNKVLTASEDPLALTIDVRLQHILRRELQNTISDFTALGGSGVIMNVKTGDILAAVSQPDFDPHQIGTAKSEQQFNRVTLGTYELGSCFKIFTTAAFLEQFHAGMNQSFDTRNQIKIGRFTISDYHPENRVQTVPEVFMHSSNIGTAMMAQQIGTAGLKNFFDQLGLFKALDFDLPEVGKPQVPNPWRDVSTLTTSYGHGIAITPLQLATATATVIGNGTLIKPQLILNHDQKKTRAQTSGERVISPDTVQKMRELMRLVVKHGTGSKAEVPGLLVGGKTGTAEKNMNGRYQQKKLLSSFVGAFPMNDPEYIVMINIDEPHPNRSSYGYATAGWTAAPTVGRVIAGMAAVLGMAPDVAVHDPADELTHYLADFKDKLPLHAPEDFAAETPTGVMPVAAIEPAAR